MKISLNDKGNAILERLIERKEQCLQRVAFTEQTLQELKRDAARAQGKLDGVAEVIAEESGIDFSKVSSYHIDTDKKEIILTLTPVDERKGEEAGHAH